ncbi:MAG: hypothetical protein A3G34_15885 [Candidatus Lindowbacteria bacterium RIFCSPLOWO2_12_FULL_62_27]|nr:MAG: hypothetical protein A3G34_15885 [Candidatus Lindowbacteria bacterium RIFCSPLOWO2_12_FULL_62_27]OGH63676.1 MAG: hypothetical protein A3I06_06835 [Candidatus Lindowbacteria bacterium RIFCSPLOWO2_02_FULL_62_12]
MKKKSKLPKPPKTFNDFCARYPDLERAWELINRAGETAGGLDEKTRRLIKLGISVGALREGAIHSGVRKASKMGISRRDIEQVVAMAAGTIGMPATVAAFSWVRDTLNDLKPRR